MNRAKMAKDFPPAARRKSAAILCVLLALTTKRQVEKTSQIVRFISEQLLIAPSGVPEAWKSR